MPLNLKLLDKAVTYLAKSKILVALTLFILSVGMAGPINTETIEVSIKKMQFIPAVITINKGDTIRWVNNEKRQYHSVWFPSLEAEESDYFFPEEFYEKTFSESGEFSYRCGPHPKMTGKVIVK